ncbi:uncharacterized protein LOC143284004 isoform X2 [Babylonia areolata]|uniref:uncharacterized protein LOC143284004 isoform X2 n=1 Tax=Babylonia areolata TaxID=304850 RepID=UPI003FD55DDF
MTDTMAESRRVEFQTIAAPKEEKKSKQRTLIPRFNLPLGESTSTTCPEFSFAELVKKEKVEKELTANTPFGDEEDCHDEVAALAKKFEEKYGPKPSKKKRKLKCLEDDYYDLGDGYDETDPFIDNTEYYDEVVPSCITTIHGGFYINRGTLDFRNVSDQEDSEAEFSAPSVRKRGRPRKILDSEDSGEEGEEVKKKKLKRKKGKEGLEGEKKKKRKVTIGPDGEKIIKRKKLIDPDKKKKTPPTVKELLKQQTASTGTPSNVNGSPDCLVPSPPHHSPKGDTPTVTEHTEGAAGAPQDGEEKKTVESEIHLPSDLPSELETAIVSIKKAAKDSKEGKCKFFSPHVNKLLLDIELASRQLAPGKRPLIYAHLAEHLPCGKETLIKRAKKLRENQQDDQLKIPIQRLKEEIDKVMPALQEQHDKEVAKARLENKEKREGGEVVKEEGVNTESDDEDKNTTSGLTTEGHSRKGNRDPRKKFKWTPEIKSLLCEIVRIKMHMFDTYKFRNQTAEEYLRTFLDNEVKILWPQGWIQTRMLFKETRSVHGRWTNPAKPKRQLVGSRSTASPTPTPTSTQQTNTGVTESVTSPSAPPVGGVGSAEPEVIEVSDIDEPVSTAIRDKGKVGGAVPEDLPRSHSGSSLKFSPNTMEAFAAATAAAVAAAASSTPKSEAAPMLGERRPHLMTEMLKRPGTTDSPAPGSGSGSRPAAATLPKTPPSMDSGISPFMAEFNRYLSNSNNSVPPSSSVSRPAPSPSPSPATPLTSKVGRVEESAGWKVDEGVGPERGRKLPPDVSPSSTRPPNAHSGHKAAMDMSQPGHYKLMTSVLIGGEEGTDFAATPPMRTTSPMKTKGEVVRDQILAKIQAEMDSVNARGDVAAAKGRMAGGGGPSNSGGVSNSQRPPPPPAHTSPHSPPRTPFSSPQKQMSSGGAGVSRQPPHPPPSSMPKQGGLGNPAVLRQPAPSLSPYTPKQGGLNAASVSRLSPSGSRPSPVARQSPKVVTRPSPSNVTQSRFGAVGRQSPKPVSRTSAGSMTRVMTVDPGRDVARSTAGGAPASQSLLSSFNPQHPTSASFPSQRTHTSPSSLSPPSARPLSMSAQKKTSPASTPTGTAPPTSRLPHPSQQRGGPPTSQPLPRVTTGQGQSMKMSVGQNSQPPRVASSHSTLLQQRSGPNSPSVSGQRTNLPPAQSSDSSQRGPPSSHTPPHALARPPGGAVAARSQGVSPSLSPRVGVIPGATAVDVHNRASVGHRSQMDKAASSLSSASPAGNQGSKSAGSTPHSRPLSQPPGSSTHTPRLQQPAAAVKGVVNKTSVTHSGTSATPPLPPGLDPQAVVSSGLFNHRPVFRPLHSLSTPRFKDAPKPPPGYSQ